MRAKEKSEKIQHSKIEDYGTWSHHFTANRKGKSGNSDRFYFLCFYNHCRLVTANTKLKDTCSLERKLRKT